MFVVDGVTVKNASKGWCSELCHIYQSCHALSFALARLSCHNTLNSCQPAYLHSLLATTPRHVLYAPPTPICCRFLMSSPHNLALLPAVSVSLPLQSGTHSLLAFALVLHHIHCVVFLNPTVTSPSVPSSGLHKCLRFGLALFDC